MSRHATVRLDGMSIPLIGVPAESTQETCLVCGGSFHLQDMTLNSQGQPRCRACLEKQTDGKKGNNPPGFSSRQPPGPLTG
jgi:hypothetical protein